MTPELTALALVPLLPLLGALFNGLLAMAFARRPKGPSTWLVAGIGCVMPLLSCVFALLLVYRIHLSTHRPPVIMAHYYTWIASGPLQIGADLLVDRLSSLMLVVITFVGLLIHVYSVGYMKEDRGFARFFCYMNLFLFSMLVLVLGRSLPVMFVGWEGVGLCSYLLIGFWFGNREYAAAGNKAFIVNRVGDVGFVLGMAWLFWSLAGAGAAPLDMLWLQTHVQGLSPAAAEGIALLLFLGAAGKSAQIPLYVWLPDAMAGPTPVSALIHAATMVTAGVYMVARLHFLYDLAPYAAGVVAAVGAATALLAALIAIAQADIKKVLAYSTISQLGYMFVAVGIGAYEAGLFHLFTHAFFKALLFLAAGVLIHGLHGEQDLSRMGGLARYFPLTHACFLVATLAIAGIWPFAGFFSKDAILARAWEGDHPVLYAVGLLTAGMTAFYMFRLYFLAFQGQYRRPIEPEPHATPWTMAVPLVVLAGGSLAAGWLNVPPALDALAPGPPAWLDHWLAPAITGGHAAHAGSAAAEYLLSGAALLVSLAGIGLAAWRYGGPGPAPARRPGWAYRLLQQKFYVDELYSWLLVRPILWFSRTVLWKDFDTGIIDGAVNGLPRVYRGVSGSLQLLQSGHARLYAFYLVLGLVACMIYYTVRTVGGGG